MEKYFSQHARLAVKNNIEQLAAAADIQISPVSMPPNRPGGRPQRLYFARTAEGRILNDGESLTGKEIMKFLKARISNPETESGSQGKCSEG